jgi:hypothetical protein
VLQQCISGMAQETTALFHPEYRLAGRYKQHNLR